MKLSKYVSLSEVACKCNCGLVPQKAMLDKFDEIREAYGAAIHITSGSRCEKHNKKIGGSKNSNHVKGLAIDVVRTPGLEEFLMKNLETLNIWIEDLASCPTWLHIQIVPPKSGKRIFRP